MFSRVILIGSLLAQLSCENWDLNNITNHPHNDDPETPIGNALNEPNGLPTMPQTPPVTPHRPPRLIPSATRDEDKITDYIADGCMTPISPASTAPLPPLDADCFPEDIANSGKFSVQNSIPARVRDWGSGGRGGAPWAFVNSKCNEFYVGLQDRIARAIPGIKETPHDLFHAHLITYGTISDGLAIVFHAKEYPADLEIIKNHYQEPGEKFNSTDPSFDKRNFLYVSRFKGEDFVTKSHKKTELKSDIYLVNGRGKCSDLFYVGKHNTVNESEVQSKLINGRKLGDINIFWPINLGRIKYNNYNFGANDNEEKNTGKTWPIRNNINDTITAWLNGISINNPVIYFLTAR